MLHSTDPNNDRPILTYVAKVFSMSSTINKKYIIAGIGELLWDMLPGNKRLGGAPANFAIHAGALGAQAAIISAVGSDQDGSEILKHPAIKNMPADYIARNHAPTGHVDIIVDANGKPIYNIQANVAWDMIELPPVTEMLASACSAVCFGSLAQRNAASRHAIHKFLSLTSRHCLRIFDINLRQSYYSRPIVEDSLRAANIFKLNEDELLILQNLLELPAHEGAALEILMYRYDLDSIALTRGSHGSLMMNRAETVQCPGISLTIKDTIGAGDSFCAAMAMGLLHGLPLAAVNRFAGTVAAYVCSHEGATPELPARLISELNRHLSFSIKEITASNHTKNTSSV